MGSEPNLLDILEDLFKDVFCCSLYFLNHTEVYSIVLFVDKY